jgi:hypothetical protein
VRGSHAFLVLAAVLLAGNGAPGHAGERLPFRLAVRIGSASPEASTSFADDAARAIIAELQAKGCFRAVVPAAAGGAPDTDLLLDVTLSDLRDEIRYDQSLAERAQPTDATEVAVGNEALLSFRTEIVLAALPGGAVVRKAGFDVQAVRRPRVPGDDARAGAQTEAIRELARKSRSGICRGSGAKLKRDIEIARTAR